MKHLQTIFKRYNNINIQNNINQQRHQSYQYKNTKKKVNYNNHQISLTHNHKSNPNHIYVKNIITSPKVVNIHNTTIKVQNPLQSQQILPRKKTQLPHHKQKIKWFQQIDENFPKTNKSISKKKFLFNKDGSTKISKIQNQIEKQHALFEEEYLKNYRENFKISNKHLKTFNQSSNFKHLFNSKQRRTKTIEYGNYNNFNNKISPKFKRYKTIEASLQQSQKSIKLINQTINVFVNSNISAIIFTPKQINWAEIKLPLTSNEVLMKYQKYLTKYEKKQILEYQQIYFIGHKAHKFDAYIQKQITYFDNSQGQYKYVIGDHIAFRYQILDTIGAGAFGQVLKIFDHKKKYTGALKIIKNKQNYYKQALIEYKILKYVSQKDKNSQTNIVKIKDFVLFRKHVCIICQLLDISLYDFMKKNKFQGFTFQLIRKFSVQILQALLFLDSHKIVHCDLKPQNIVMKQQGKSGIKIIDFGTSCFQFQKFYTYIQSRFYRSPQIVLGIPYNTKIDMWSFGCIAAQLFTGYPLFPGESEQQHMCMIIDTIGLPGPDFLITSTRYKVFFTTDFSLKPNILKFRKSRNFQQRSLESILDCDDEDFIDFVSKCLKWNPKQRMSPRQGLMHNFILNGLPSQIKNEHIKQMNSKNPYGLLNQK